MNVKRFQRLHHDITLFPPNTHKYPQILDITQLARYARACLRKFCLRRSSEAWTWGYGKWWPIFETLNNLPVGGSCRPFRKSVIIFPTVMGSGPWSQFTIRRRLKNALHTRRSDARCCQMTKNNLWGLYCHRTTTFCVIFTRFLFVWTLYFWVEFFL